MAGSCGSSGLATRRPSLEVGPVQPPANTWRATGGRAASGCRQLLSPEGGATYAAVAVVAAQAATAAPQQPSGPLMPTAKNPDPSEPAVSHETA